MISRRNLPPSIHLRTPWEQGLLHLSLAVPIEENKDYGAQCEQGEHFDSRVGVQSTIVPFGSYLYQDLYSRKLLERMSWILQ